MTISENIVVTQYLKIKQLLLFCFFKIFKGFIIILEKSFVLTNMKSDTNLKYMVSWQYWGWQCDWSVEKEGSFVIRVIRWDHFSLEFHWLAHNFSRELNSDKMYVQPPPPLRSITSCLNFSDQLLSYLLIQSQLLLFCCMSQWFYCPLSCQLSILGLFFSLIGFF